MDSFDESHEPADPASERPFIEYWVWHDGELIPATKEELVWIHEREREREARWRLGQWQQLQRRQTRWQPVRAVCAALAGRLAIYGQRITHAGAPRKQTDAATVNRAPPTER